MVIDATLNLDELVRDERDRFWINSRVYSDPAIFDLEMQRIFHRGWIYVAHETEVPDGGDYKQTLLGRHPVIVTRSSDDGQVRVFFNRCRHRGATVCQMEFGNANYFRCAYHGWVYKNDGGLVGVPFEEGYGEGFDKEKLGLVQVPRVDSYQGFVFASLSPDGPSLLEHLGKTLPYIDKFVAMAPDGLQVSTGTHKFSYDGNWKVAAENSVDGYHTNFVHASYLEIVSRRSGRPIRMAGGRDAFRSWDLGNGHAALDIEPGGLNAPHGASRGDKIGPGFNLYIFPNLVLLFTQIRHLIPTAFNRTDVRLQALHFKGATPEVNAQILREHEMFYSPGGLAAPDDWEMFVRLQSGVRTDFEPWVRFDRGLGQEDPVESGAVFSGQTDESPQRAIYKQWKRVMAQA